MAQTPWQDLIPYYVARTLPPAQMQAFEAQLDRDKDLRQEVEEWRRIAAAVWREADSAARRLPPLSPEVYQKLQYRNGAQPTTTTGVIPGAGLQHKSWLSSSPLMMVAGFLVVFLCGGMILFTAARQLQPEVIDTDGTNVALNATNEFGGPAAPTATATPNATMVLSLAVINTGESTWTPAPRGTATPVLVVPLPTTTPTRRPVNPPTITPQGHTLTVSTPDKNQVNVPMTLTYEAVYGTSTPWPDDLCIVTNSEGGAQPLYAYADYSAPVVGYWSAGETTWVMARTASNWIEIFFNQWLPAGNLVFRGPCDSVPEPSPTAPSMGSGQCVATNSGANEVPLYQSASMQSQILNYLPVGQSTSVFVRASGSWFETFYNGQLGWFMADGISFTGDCANLPVPSPTYTPTTAAATEVPLQTVFNKPMIITAREGLMFYNGPYYNSGVAMSVDAGSSWTTYGLTSIAGIEWAAVAMGDGRTLWAERLLVDLVDPGIATPTLPTQTPPMQPTS